MKTFLRIFLIVWAAVAPLAASETSPPLRLLTVGNSFADNMVRYLPDLAQAAGLSVTLGRANVSGASLQKHWEAVAAGQQGRQNDARIYPAGIDQPRRSLAEALGDGTWDVITIQQASLLSDQAATYQPYAGNLVSFLRQHAPQAVIAFHQTWAYRGDDPKFSHGSTPDDMYAAIQQASRAVARELALPIIPVGTAFHLAQERPEWTYRPEQGFDFRSRTPARLPQQDGSLHVGWRWSSKNSLQMYLDAHHANVAGRYLAGCVLFGFLFDRSPVGNAFHPPELTAAQVRSLQDVAAEALASNEKILPNKP